VTTRDLPTNTAPRPRFRNRTVAIACAGLVVSMAGLAYAAVPLYQIFCQVTGLGGTTQVAGSAPTVIGEAPVNVRFDANVARQLDWSFKPGQGPVTVKVGESAVIEYVAENKGDRLRVGTATFNVTPAWAGAYFYKVECFCFTEQKLEPGQVARMSVEFFIDPDIVEDDAFAALDAITLSYTFYEDAAATARMSEVGGTAPRGGTRG
jgi:cytochrome c oxidase assembly protein subunit 11